MLKSNVLHEVPLPWAGNTSVVKGLGYLSKEESGFDDNLEKYWVEKLGQDESGQQILEIVSDDAKDAVAEIAAKEAVAEPTPEAPVEDVPEGVAEPVAEIPAIETEAVDAPVVFSDDIVEEPKEEEPEVETKASKK